MFQRYSAIFVVALATSVTGCTWVDLKPAAKNVQIGYAGDIAQCQRVGMLTVNTQSKLILERDEAKVQKELYTLARNNAAAIGATNLVQHGMPKNGEQAFTSYRCSDIG